MIICTKCSAAITYAENQYQCQDCGKSYRVDDNVLILDDEDQVGRDYDYEADLKEIRKIRDAEDVHFWFKCQDTIILSLFKRYVSYDDSCIDIGAGTGRIAGLLQSHGYDMTTGERHPEGIKINKEGSFKRIYQFDLLRNPFRSEFDVVGMFDVLEHIRDDKKVLQGIFAMLKPKGRLILSVPAHMWLWCKDDEVSQHCRRYELHELKRLLGEMGFQILSARNRFVGLLPLLYLRAKSRLYSDVIRIHPVMNFLLEKICMLENGMIERMGLQPSLGGSIFIVAQKQGEG